MKATYRTRYDGTRSLEVRWGKEDIEALQGEDDGQLAKLGLDGEPVQLRHVLVGLSVLAGVLDSLGHEVPLLTHEASV